MSRTTIADLGSTGDHPGAPGGGAAVPAEAVFDEIGFGTKDVDFLVFVTQTNF